MIPTVKTHAHLLVICVVFFLSGTAEPACSETIYLDNGVLVVGIDVSRGGAISYLSEYDSYESVVNVHDLGRYIQQSYYSGPTPFIPPGATQHPSYAGWSWNPVQAGDAFGNRSLVVDESNDGVTLYVKCIPKQWALNNVDTECTLEAWITLDDNRVHVRNRLVNAREDATRYGGFHQELPAVYTVGTLHRLYTYTGTAPFTGDGLTLIANSGPPWEYWNSTENWSALVDDADWGLGIHHPGAYLTVGGFHGAPGWGGPTGDNTGYIAPLHTDVLDHDIVYDHQYTLILGDLHDDIRSYVYTQAPNPGPNHVFSLDRQHFLSYNLIDEAPPFAGFWRLILDQNDPQIVCPPTLWNAEDVPRISIRGAYNTQNDQAEIFFAGENGAFSGDKRLAFTIIPDGAIRTYEVDLSSHPLYTGLITRLRFDPIQGRTPGDVVDLYWLTADSPTGASDTVPDPIPEFVLEPNYPNPFNPRTTISYNLVRQARVTLRIHDLAGRLVKLLVESEEQGAGSHSAVWRGRDDTGRAVASGTYFYRLEAGGANETRRMVMVR